MTITQPKGLMSKLARALGVSLQALQREGRISPAAVRRMQSRCALCGEPAVCARLIERDGAEMDAPPEFCPNRRLFLALKTAHGKR